MIKLFGWENQVKESVGEKREEELRWVWKGKLLGMISDIAKCVMIWRNMLSLGCADCWATQSHHSLDAYGGDVWCLCKYVSLMKYACQD